MSISIGVVGAGQFAPSFLRLWTAHPDVTAGAPDRRAAGSPAEMAAKQGVAITYQSFEEMLDSDVDAVAIFTQRWLHGEMAIRALEAGKHVYSTVPMAIEADQIARIIELVKETGLTYMMGETSFYYPSSVYCRDKLAKGEFGRVFYCEGDYVHDMDLGFYSAYQYSGGEDWKKTASFPPMLYPTHAVGNVLSVTGQHATHVSCIGVQDDRGDGVFDKEISQFDNDFCNATALFKLADGGVMRTNEMRRVGYPSHIRESRLRVFGTEGSFEQLATTSVWQTKEGVEDISQLMETVEPVHSTTLTSPTWTRHCAMRSVPACRRCTTAAACLLSSTACTTGTRVRTTSSPTTSSARSPTRPSRRSTPGSPPASRSPASTPTSPRSKAASNWRSPTTATPPRSSSRGRS